MKKRKVTAQLKKLKRELAQYKALALANPQFGHDRALNDSEKRFVTIMRQTEPQYCLPGNKLEWSTWTGGI